MLIIESVYYIMAIIVKEVDSKKELIKWVRFPNELYKDNKNFVPFLENDEIDTFLSKLPEKSVFEFVLNYENFEIYTDNSYLCKDT